MAVATVCPSDKARRKAAGRKASDFDFEERPRHQGSSALHRSIMPLSSLVWLCSQIVTIGKRDWIKQTDGCSTGRQPSPNKRPHRLVRPGDCRDGRKCLQELGHRTLHAAGVRVAELQVPQPRP